MNYQNYPSLYTNNLLKNLFISEIFKFIYLTHINKKIYKPNKPIGLVYTLTNFKLNIGKNLLTKLNTNLVLLQIKFDMNIQIYLYKNKNIFYTIVYNYITNKVINININ